MKNNEKDPRDWLRRAESLLNRIKETRRSRKIINEHFCVDAQQISELSIKGVLSHLSIPFQRTHSINVLCDLLEKNGYKIPPVVRESEVLSVYITTRYPGDYDEITKEEKKEAIRIAKKVFKWAEKIISEEKKLFK